jgi:hypothetical protein
MPLYVKIDFREDGRLGAWWTREEHGFGRHLNSIVAETRVRDVLVALADELDPIAPPEPSGVQGKENAS